MPEFRQTVGHAIKCILPIGTNDKEFWSQLNKVAIQNEDITPWNVPPLFPTDLFAVAGYLCKIGGVIPFFNPDPYVDVGTSLQFSINTGERRLADHASKVWRETDTKNIPPTMVQECWARLIKSWNDPITSETYESPPDWWQAALLLIMVSDMACPWPLRGSKNSAQPQRWIESWLRGLYLVERAGDRDKYKPPASLTLMVDTSVACVLPKMRVSPVGATLRNASRNLCLLPGRGEVQCIWETPIEVPPSEDTQTLDILLIPEPHRIDASYVFPHEDKNRKDSDKHYDKMDWEYFGIHQNWIKGDDGSQRMAFVLDCIKLLEAAKKEARTINGVILPEYAVDFDLFEEISQKLKRVEPNLEFVISGSSNAETKDNEENGEEEAKSGNHVLTKVWYLSNNDPKQDITQSRPKHHRWRMDRSQVQAYALSSALNPKIKYWWENIPLGRRELIFHRFRENSVFSVLICEELARSDPCHDILRSVGPNLIFALLLDGPQIQKRWPAQYASNLADDPGSAVLTFTSYGLIDRANKQGHFDENRSVAMWKDDSGRVVEIPMPKGEGMRGIVLSLWSEHLKDSTITGKLSIVRAWRYASHFPVTIK